MIKDIIAIAMVFTLFNVSYSSFQINAAEKSIEVEIIYPNEILKIDKLLDDSSNALSEEDKIRLKEIKMKMESYEVISQEELDFIRQCDLNIIKNKLGEADFNEYIKLIKKRAGKEEFSQDERIKLFYIEKKLKGIK